MCCRLTSEMSASYCIEGAGSAGEELFELLPDRGKIAIFVGRLDAQNARLPLPGLLRQSVFSSLAGYEDTNDAERLCVDPALV